MAFLSLQRQSSLVTRPVVILALTLLVCLPPLLMRLGERASTHTMENVALVVSQETWLRWHAGDASALWLTSNDGLPRFQKPPLATWLILLAWSDLDPETATADQLTYRARLVSAALGLLTLAAIFWLGYSLREIVHVNGRDDGGGARMAAIAALAAGSSFFFQRQARTASYDIHFVAWATLAVAAGVWVIRSRATSQAVEDAHAGRRILGWLICGLATACSVMSKNPMALAIVVLPLMGAIILTPANRKSNCIGLAGALALALIPISVWYLYVTLGYPEAKEILKNEFTQPRAGDAQSFYYYLGLFGLLAPWTLWLICGLVQPFKFAREQIGVKRAALIALVWFVIILLMFSVPPAKQQRYILPIVPAAALLIAQFFRAQQASEERGERDAVVRVLIAAHWLALLAASAAFATFLFLQGRVGAASGGWLQERQIEAQPLFTTLGAGAILLLIALVGWAAQTRGRALLAAALTALWGLVLTCIIWHSYPGAPGRVAAVMEFRRTAEHAREIVGAATLYSLRVSPADQEFIMNEEFRFFYRRLIPRVNPEGLEQLPADALVLARAQGRTARLLQAEGFEMVDEVRVDERDVRGIWRRARATPQAAGANRKRDSIVK